MFGSVAYLRSTAGRRVLARKVGYIPPLHASHQHRTLTVPSTVATVRKQKEPTADLSTVSQHPQPKHVKVRPLTVLKPVAITTKRKEPKTAVSQHPHPKHVKDSSQMKPGYSKTHGVSFNNCAFPKCSGTSLISTLVSSPILSKAKNPKVAEKQNDRRMLWLRNIGIRNLSPTLRVKICPSHMGDDNLPKTIGIALDPDMPSTRPNRGVAFSRQLKRFKSTADGVVNEILDDMIVEHERLVRQLHKQIGNACFKRCCSDLKNNSDRYMYVPILDFGPWNTLICNFGFCAMDSLIF